MSEGWYYAEGSKPVGPLSLADLTAILSRVSGAKDVLVWQDGFETWKRAADVPELRTFVIRPPSLPPLPPPLPPSSPTLNQKAEVVPAAGDRIVQAEPGATQPSVGKGPKITGGVATVVVMLVVAGLVRAISHSGTESSPADPMSTISGKVRDNFIEGGMKTCLKRQEDDPDTKALSISRSMLVEYCSCYMSNLADAITVGELRSYPKDGSITPAMQKKMEMATPPCQEKLRKSLLGG